ncbi:MAG: hypothetical protein AAF652_10010 [Cyanobacteria bacterium P01_C01_bin.72]
MTTIFIFNYYLLMAIAFIQALITENNLKTIGQTIYAAKLHLV